MEEVLKLQAQIKEIKAMYAQKKENVNNQRQELKQKIKLLHDGIGITYQQIHQLNKELAELGKEFDRLEHETKVATHPLRTKIWEYMEALRKEIRTHENATIGQ